jgi:hypothetical protein
MRTPRPRHRRVQLGLLALVTAAFTLAGCADASVPDELPQFGAPSPTASPRPTECASGSNAGPRRTAGVNKQAKVTGVEIDRDICPKYFDRLVFTIDGLGKVGYNIYYVNSVASPTTGKKVEVDGAATLLVTIGASAREIWKPGDNIPIRGGQLVKQVKLVESNGAGTTFAVGLASKRGFELAAWRSEDTQTQFVALNLTLPDRAPTP